ncbi:MAG: hypothetical protein JJT94_08125 [Bernardetiaceae bacterium]|nr:hypothetical protein [Bernardetiaceae bacterium]
MSRAMNLSQDEQVLWERISRFFVDSGCEKLSFIDRLKRENGWNHDYALRCFTEYKKFMFLICISPQPLTPSDEIDQVWHLHLLYTRSYWEDFCQKTLNQNIHHGPTKGGKKEGEKFMNYYEFTKKIYTLKFEIEPPSDIWKPSEIRFREVYFKRVNMHRYFILPKPQQLWHGLKNLLRHKPN